MKSLIVFLNRRKLFTASMQCIYFLATVLMHEKVSLISVWFQRKLTTSAYNDMLATAGLIMISVFSFFILIRIRKEEDRGFKALYIFTTLLLAVFAFHTLLTINAEFIHFFQYAILAVPIFAITLKFGETVFWVTFLGVLDEAYQYFVLYPDFAYFDFNDVILNLIGGAIGIILILAVLKKFPSGDLSPTLTSGRRTGSTVFILTALLLGILIAYLMGYVHAYPSPGTPDHAFVMNRGPAPSTFWKTVKWGKRFHVLHPLEGVIITGCLIWFYSLIDYRMRKKFLPDE